MSWHDYTERRRVPRAPAHLELRELNGQPGPDSYLLDLSKLGAKLETSRAFIPGDQVEFSFISPEKIEETCLRGRVIWVLPAPAAPGRRLIGLEFFDPIPF